MEDFFKYMPHPDEPVSVGKRDFGTVFRLCVQSRYHLKQQLMRRVHG